jgi:cytochrome d ubiquinol oxidase subunit I
LMMRMALNLLIIIVPLQIILGDLHGRNTLDQQPAKLAAIEGLWQSAGPMPEALFAIPDQAAHKNTHEIDVPHLGSLILTHSWNGRVRGLEEWPPDQWPPVWPVFFAFRIMVGIALLMLTVVVIGWILRLRGDLYDSAWFLRLCQWFAPAGFVAVLMGWTTSEVGRQPWTVYGVFRTADSVTPSLTGRDVLASLLMYVAVYLIMYPAGVGYMAALVRHGLQPGEEVGEIEAGHPRIPIAEISGRPGGGAPHQVGGPAE